MEFQGFMLAFLVWIGAHTDYNVSNMAPPRVEYRTFTELYKMGYGKNAKIPGLPKIWAVYDDGVAYLHSDFDINNVKDRSRLFHEVVHHVQKEDGRLFRCDSAMEPEAYRLQKKWLEEQGADWFGPDEGELSFEYSCGPNEDEEIERRYL